MARRFKPDRRPVAPDPKYKSTTISMFVNRMMISGKKSTAQRVIYNAFDLIEQRAGKPGIEVMADALKTVAPAVEVKPRRVGGATYQVPIEVAADRREALAMRWIIAAARSRSGRSMAEKLANELMDAANGTGSAIRRKEETHKMAESNRAFSHYRF